MPKLSNITKLISLPFNTKGISQFIYHLETNIMPGIIIFGSNIPQANNQKFHERSIWSKGTNRSGDEKNIRNKCFVSQNDSLVDNSLT